MGRGDFGFDGLYSLRAVDSWIAVINSNLNAAGRTGYKASKVKFRGGVTETVRNPVGPLLGIQLPETTIQIDQTGIDFSQGSIVSSTEPTHLAIQGRGFFALSTTIGGPPQYYTRDGEFHVIADAANGNQLQLVHSTGLYLVGNAAGQRAVLDQPNGRVVMNGVIANVFDETDILNTNTPNFLRFSRYGSTVFEATVDSTMAAMLAGAARVVPQTLESSNSSLSQTLPELSLAQKFFSAVSKVISVHQTNLDTVINLVR